MENDTSSSESLVKENATLRSELAQYKSLEEDLMARRVFDKAKSYLITWITAGGIALTLSGVIGIKLVVDYTKHAVQDKIKSISDAKVEASLETIGEDKVNQYVEVMKGQLADFGRQQIQVALIASGPIKDPRTSNQVAGGIATLIDYSGDMAPARDQGDEGSATGFAVASALEYQVYAATKQRVVLSPRLIYYLARRALGSTNTDSGAAIKDAVNAVTNEGTVEESVWPYRAGQYSISPPASTSTARRFRATTPDAILTLSQIKSALNRGPVVAGLSIFSGSTSAEALKTGVLPMPSPKDVPMGEQAICIVGYDDSQKRIKFRNSWGPGWGDHGYGYASYDYFERYLGGEAWTFQYRPN